MVQQRDSEHEEWLADKQARQKATRARMAALHRHLQRHESEEEERKPTAAPDVFTSEEEEDDDADEEDADSESDQAESG